MSDKPCSVIEECPLEKKRKELADKPEDSVIIYCEHGRMFDPLQTIHLVPDPVSEPSMEIIYTDKLTIEWIGPNKPATLSIKCSDVDIDQESEIPDSGNFIVNLSYKKPKFTESSIIEQLTSFVTFGQRTKYTIYGLPTGNVNIYVYNPEAYCIELGLEPLKSFGKKESTNHSFSGGGKETASESYSKGLTRDGFVNNKTSIKESNIKKVNSKLVQRARAWDRKISAISDNSNRDLTNSDAVTEAESNITVGNVTYNNDTKLSQKKFGDLKEINIYRTGEQLQLDAFSIVNNILSIVKGITKIISLIAKYSPKWGFYFEANVQVFTGSIAFGWAWKEHTDNQAYYQLYAVPNIDIIYADVEVGFGLSGCGLIQAKVYAKLYGKVTLSESAELLFYTDSTDIDNSIVLSLLTKIGVEIGAVFEVSQILQLTAAIESAINVAGAWEIFAKEGKGPSANMNIEWTGIFVRYTAKGGFFGLTWDKNGQKQLVDHQHLCDFQFPKEKMPDDKRDFKKIKSRLVSSFNDMLKGKMKADKKFEELEFVDYADRKSEYKNFNSKSVAKAIANRFYKESINWEQSESVFLSRIRKDLDMLPKITWQRGWKLKDKDVIHISQIRSYLNHPNINSLIKNYECPIIAKEMKLKKDMEASVS